MNEHETGNVNGAQMGSDEGIIVGEVVKNRNERIVLRLAEYEGRLTFDLRCWMLNPVTGKFDVPTRKGITSGRHLLRDLAALLETAADIAEREGAVEDGG